MLVVLFVSLLLGVNAQTVWDGTFPRVQWFGDIAADDLFRAPANPANPTSQWGGPLDAPQQKPQSYRTFSVCFNPLAIGGPNFFAGAAAPNTPAVAAPDTLPAGSQNPAANERRMVISLVAPADLTVPASGAQLPLGTGVNFEVKMEHPWLELDPWQCPSFGNGGIRNPAASGNCRCNYNGIYDGVDRPQDRWNVRGNPMVINFPLGSRNASFDIPNWTYFEHAPVANQHPYMKTYRKLCMRPQQSPGQATPDVWMDTTVWIAVVHCCQDPTINPANTNFQCTNTRFQTSLSYSWNKVTLPDTAIDAEWICNRAGFLGEFFDFARFPTTTLGPNTPQPVSFGAAVGSPSIAADSSLCWGETTAMTLARWQRTQCCGARPALASGGKLR